MAELVEIVDALEHKVRKLLHRLALVQRTNTELKEALTLAKKENHHNQNTILEWTEKYNSLKMANAILGSNTNTTETKLKINNLIRELDVCIAKLAN